MKRNLIIVITLVIFSGSCFQQNKRNVQYNLLSGDQIKTLMYEETNLVDQVRVLKVYVDEHYLIGRECKDVKYRQLANELWSEIIKENNLSELSSGAIYFLRTKSEYCGYHYHRNENGEWSKYY